MKIILSSILFLISHSAMGQVIEKNFEKSHEGSSKIEFQIGSTNFQIDYAYEHPPETIYFWKICPGVESWSLLISQSYCSVNRAKIDTIKKILYLKVQKHKPNDPNRGCLKKSETVRIPFDSSCQSARP